VNRVQEGAVIQHIEDIILRISVVEVLLPTFTARQEVQDPVAQGGVQTQGPELNDELGGYYGVEC
jgi:hypothetical protein